MKINWITLCRSKNGIFSTILISFGKKTVKFGAFLIKRLLRRLLFSNGGRGSGSILTKVSLVRFGTLPRKELFTQRNIWGK